MSLINGPECRTEVSNIAEACPKCGAPIAKAIETQTIGTRLTTVQETSKKLKLQIILSSILFWGGLGFFYIIFRKEEGAFSNYVNSWSHLVCDNKNSCLVAS